MRSTLLDGSVISNGQKKKEIIYDRVFFFFLLDKNGRLAKRTNRKKERTQSKKNKKQNKKVDRKKPTDNTAER